MSWLTNALNHANKPKESIIGVLKKNLGGHQVGRSYDVVHASNITSYDFCPRKWALRDIVGTKKEPEFLQTAMDVTFQIGNMTETLLVEEWAGDAAIGNWKCRYCGDQRSMVSKPGGNCKDGRKHWWQYLQLVLMADEYEVSGAVDCLFNVGSPRLMIAEVKILNTEDFDKILVPFPEHRLRTSLYMKLVAESSSVYKDKINTQESRVLYVSRGYGKMNPMWNEILPFKEFVVTRDDALLVPMLKKAKAIKLFRSGWKNMPNGICDTALDSIAKRCGQCKACFSGDHPPTIAWQEL